MALSIDSFMTREPRCIEVGTPIREAYRLMRELGVRHFPVMHGGQVQGVLSQRDLLRVETLETLDRSLEPVSTAMSAPPYFVEPEAPIELVVEQMAERKIGSAVVVLKGEVVGIFTTTDALRAFAALLRRGAIEERRRVFRSAGLLD